MSERTHIKHQIIDIMDNHFPESGFPDQIIFNEKYIIIISRMCDDSIEYKHKDYSEDNFKNINLFSKTDLKFIANIKMKYCSYNAVFFKDLIFFSSGVYGDYLRGELICYDIKNNFTIKCSDESRPVHWLALKDNLIEIYTFKPIGYYENELEKFYVINPTANLFMDWSKEKFVPFSEDDLEDLLNEHSHEKRLNTLNFLIFNKMTHNLYNDILPQLHIKFGDDKFVFTKNSLPKLEDNNIDTYEIIVTKMWHHYNDYHRVEMLNVSCTKKQYQLLGLLMLDYLFNRKDILISLTNNASVIKKIRIGNKTENDRKEFGLIQENISFNYWPTEISHRYPFQDLKTFPNFNLTNDEDKSMITEADWASRDCLQISGDDDTLAKVAELFLNIGHNDNTLDEIVLESAVGYGGVSHGSVEVRFWLPGSIGYNEN